jgi:hypothetical protein
MYLSGKLGFSVRDPFPVRQYDFRCSKSFLFRVRVLAIPFLSPISGTLAHGLHQGLFALWCGVGQWEAQVGNPQGQGKWGQAVDSLAPFLWGQGIAVGGGGHSFCDIPFCTPLGNLVMRRRSSQTWVAGCPSVTSHGDHVIPHSFFVPCPYFCKCSLFSSPQVPQFECAVSFPQGPWAVVFSTSELSALSELTIE